MNVPSNNGASAAFIFYARPRAYLNDEVKVDKVMFFIPNSALIYDTLHTYTLEDFHIMLNDETTYTNLNDFLKIRINENTTFEPKIHYRGSQQILSFILSGITNNYLNCSIHQAKIETNDDRTITLSCD